MVSTSSSRLLLDADDAQMPASLFTHSLFDIRAQAFPLIDLWIFKIYFFSPFFSNHLSVCWLLSLSASIWYSAFFYFCISKSIKRVVFEFFMHPFDIKKSFDIFYSPPILKQSKNLFVTIKEPPFERISTNQSLFALFFHVFYSPSSSFNAVSPHLFMHLASRQRPVLLFQYYLQCKVLLTVELKCIFE